MQTSVLAVSSAAHRMESTLAPVPLASSWPMTAQDVQVRASHNISGTIPGLEPPASACMVGGSASE